MKWHFAVGLVMMVTLLAVPQAHGLKEFPFIPGSGTNPNYKTPDAKGPVAVLFDDDAADLLPIFWNDGDTLPEANREEREVFTGLSSMRVTPLQRYASRIQGWAYRIVKEPKNPGEFRYVRFAWKKVGGNGITIQFYNGSTSSWEQRYTAGVNPQSWPAKSVSKDSPREWTVVTRDLFEDFGEMNISGMAFSPLDGTCGYFDHVCLGRTIEDLDKHLDAALGKVAPKTAPTEKEIKQLVEDLRGGDQAKASAALRALLASAPDVVPVLLKMKQTAPQIDLDEAKKKIAKYTKELEDDSFDVRETATKELLKLGTISQCSEEVQRLANSQQSSPEVLYRANFILKKWGVTGTDLPPETAIKLRSIRILERAKTKEALAELEVLSQEKGTAGEVARTALKRLK
jgi:hypothetical protein